MKNIIASKIIEGLGSQGWHVLGYGGTWTAAIRPLEQYIQRKVDRAVNTEREACAVAGAAAAMAGQDYIGVAAAIRARGNT